jgi:hypothetical protein
VKTKNKIEAGEDNQEKHGSRKRDERKTGSEDNADYRQRKHIENGRNSVQSGGECSECTSNSVESIFVYKSQS